jgi:hypothetical protein
MGVREPMKYLTEVENSAALAAEMPPGDRSEYDGYGHNRIESAFVDRDFVVYECQGRDSKNIQRPPKILTTVRVIDFRADYASGCEVRLLDKTTQDTLKVGHVPRRVFDYPVFMAVPARLRIAWDAQWHGDRLMRSLLFAVLIKARNKSEFLSKGNVYMETPNRVRELFPHVELNLST